MSKRPIGWASKNASASLTPARSETAPRASGTVRSNVTNSWANAPTRPGLPGALR